MTSKRFLVSAVAVVAAAGCSIINRFEDYEHREHGGAGGAEPREEGGAKGVGAGGLENVAGGTRDVSDAGGVPASAGKGPDNVGGDGGDDAAGSPCGAGTIRCDGLCVVSDADNCGACGAECANDEVCLNGVCSCPSGLVECDDACVDTDSDPANCGACGTECIAPTPLCSLGVCSSSCAAGQTDCSGACVDMLTSRAHCGACGIACATDETCVSGQCECTPPRVDCNGTCVDLEIDPDNCGTCGAVCQSGQCSGGDCVVVTGTGGEGGALAGGTAGTAGMDDDAGTGDTGGNASSTGGTTGGTAGNTGGTESGGAATGGTPDPPDRCTIDSTSYASGDPNPANSCQTCQPTVDDSHWVALPEGSTCDGTNYCHSGTCQAGCWIQSTFYGSGAAKPSYPCLTCQPSTNRTDWTISATNCGCTGDLEMVQATTGLCVARMVTTRTPTVSVEYSMDATEVTRMQYEMWAATNPVLPPSSDENCGWKSAGSYAADATCMNEATVCKSSCSHHPVVCVDWCDAREYCAAIGKRLCGDFTGGSSSYDDFRNETQSQWLWACTSGGTYACSQFPYGLAYEADTCNGRDHWADITAATTVEVASMTDCKSPQLTYTGVYDLSGNVWEWTDACNGTGAIDGCLIRGGSFSRAYTEDLNDLACCDDYSSMQRQHFDDDTGIRCCSR